MQVEYHQPYSRDIHHGEYMFPGVRGHEREEYEQAEGYASPDDVTPEVRIFIITFWKRKFTAIKELRLVLKVRHFSIINLRKLLTLPDLFCFYSSIFGIFLTLAM